MTPVSRDHQLVRRHLAALDSALAQLRRHMGRPVAVLSSDLDERWAVERGLLVCAQNCLDMFMRRTVMVALGVTLGCSDMGGLMVEDGAATRAPTDSAGDAVTNSPPAADAADATPAPVAADAADAPPPPVAVDAGWDTRLALDADRDLPAAIDLGADPGLPLDGGMDAGVALDGAGDDQASPPASARIVFNPQAPGRPLPPHVVFTNQPFFLPLAVVDGAGNRLPWSSPITLAIEETDYSGILWGADTYDPIIAWAGPGGLRLDHWGTVHLVATSPGAAPFRIELVAHGAYRRYLVQPSDTVAGQAMVPAVQAAVFDDTGAIDGSFTSMTLGLVGCGHSIASLATTVTQAGIATFTGLAIGPACDSHRLYLAVTPYVSYDWQQNPFPSDPFKVIAGPPTKVVLSTANGFVPRQAPFTVLASITDASGNTIDVAPTAITLSLAGATLGGTLTQSTVGGVATFGDLVIAPAGSYVLTGRADGYQDGTLALLVSSWELRSQPGSSADVEDLAVAIDDADTIFAYTRDETLVSHDGASTWTVMQGLPFPGRIVPHPSNASILWSTSGGTLSRSLDHGSTWELLGGDTVADKLIIDARLPDRMFSISTESPSGTSGHFWMSEDGGATWTMGGPSREPGDRYWDMAYDSANRLLYVAAGQYGPSAPLGYLARSSDGGKTWTKLPGVPLIRNLAVDPFAPTTLFGTEEVYFRLGQSTDSGATWTWSESTGGLLACNPASQGHLLLGNQTTGGIFRSSDGGATWSTSFGDQEMRNPFPTAIAFSRSSPGVVYAAVNGAVLRSVTGGE